MYRSLTGFMGCVSLRVCSDIRSSYRNTALSVWFASDSGIYGHIIVSLLKASSMPVILHKSRVFSKGVEDVRSTQHRLWPGQRPHNYTRHGITIEDPWHWLRDPGYPNVDDADVLEYLGAENDYFEAMMSPHK